MFKPWFLIGALLLWTGAAAAAAPAILVLGDSLGAGYGIEIAAGWPHLLQEKLAGEGYRHRVINASVSGDTTSGGLARLPELLARHRPQIVLVELGGNDGLRALPLSELRGNLRKIVQACRKAGAQPILFEMRVPPNYGLEYSEKFRKTFDDVAAETHATLVPFFLSAIALKPEYFQDDGIHPNARAQPLLLDALWPTVKAALGSASSATLSPAGATHAVPPPPVGGGKGEGRSINANPVHKAPVTHTSTRQPSLWRRRVVAPIAAQLTQGIMPEQIALTLALGAVIGVFPILGTTTWLCLAAGIRLRLNQPIIQLANYLVYPLQLALLIPFLRAGEWLGAPHLSLSLHQLIERFQAGPWRFILDFGLIGLGGAGIWCLAAPAMIAGAYLTLRPFLRALAAGLRPASGSD